jgi:phage repressor protein C with HTH and peptisase S24 domain
MHAPALFASLFDMDGGSIEADGQLVRSLIEWANLTPNAIAKRTGVAPSTINRHANGTAENRLGRNTINKMREAFPDFPGFNALRPDLPVMPRPQDYVTVRILPSYAGMGGGGTGEGDIETGLVPRQLVENELRGHPDNFQLINVRGDSMEPIFSHGDQLLVDLRDRNPIQPGPFAIMDDSGAYLVKLVERIPGKRGFYRIFSANERYSETEVEETETTIMGRPVWFARRL